MGLAEELQNLQQLHQSGALSDEEFAKAKQRLLESQPAAAQPAPQAYAKPAPLEGEALERETRQWAMFLHLSQLTGFVVPLAGLAAPIVIWQIKKDELPGIDAHGKAVLNWMISMVIYCLPLCLLCIIPFGVCIGFPVLAALGITGVVFAIMGGLKANNGELWKYPLSITFLK